MVEQNDTNDEGAPDDDVYIIDDTEGSLEEYAASEEIQSAGAEKSGSERERAAEGDSDQARTLREENGKLQDQLIRARADFENFRKRSEREKADYFKYALAGTIRELLPVVDNFERALAHDSDAGSEFHKGVELIAKQFAEFLQRSGLKEISEGNVPFDPAMHEAVMREETNSVPPNTVIDLFQKGYFLHDRLLRPALVKVAVGIENPTESEGQPEE